MTLKIGHPKRKLVFQPSIFRCYVGFREGTAITGSFAGKKAPEKVPANFIIFHLPESTQENVKVLRNVS